VRFARWLTLALFAAVSLLGQGLHLLNCRYASPPRGERAAATAGGATASARACGHCCHHDGCYRHAAETPAADDDGPGGDGPGIRSAPAHGDDCPICRFFAQGQLAACETPLLSGQFAAPHRSAAAVDLPFVAALEPYQARGPPALL